MSYYTDFFFLEWSVLPQGYLSSPSPISFYSAMCQKSHEQQGVIFSLRTPNLHLLVPNLLPRSQIFIDNSWYFGKTCQLCAGYWKGTEKLLKLVVLLLSPNGSYKYFCSCLDQLGRQYGHLRALRRTALESRDPSKGSWTAVLHSGNVVGCWKPCQMWFPAYELSIRTSEIYLNYCACAVGEIGICPQQYKFA